MINYYVSLFSATLIVKYLSSKRPFFQSFDKYLIQIISVLSEQSVQVSTCREFQAGPIRTRILTRLTRIQIPVQRYLTVPD